MESFCFVRYCLQKINPASAETAKIKIKTPATMKIPADSRGRLAYCCELDGIKEGSVIYFLIFNFLYSSIARSAAPLAVAKVGPISFKVSFKNAGYSTLLKGSASLTSIRNFDTAKS